MLKIVLLRHRIVKGLSVGILRNSENRTDIESVGLPMLDRVTGLEHLDMTHRLLDASEAQFCEKLTYFLCDEFEKVHDELWLPAEA